MQKVSAVIITFNEETDIARALGSIAWCNEVLVVDSGSTDRTVEICAAHGCKVLHREFSGYGEQKAFAVTQAANDWVFVVDADEEVPPALRDEILLKLGSAGDCRGFRVPITTVLWDKIIRTHERHTNLKLRLFDRRYGNFGKQLVHESVSLNGRTELLSQWMYNHSYANIADYFDKFNRYTSAAALQCFLEGKRSGVSGAVARLPLTFFQLLFVKGYICDGAIGLTWSLFSAFYPAVKYLKLWELQRAAAWQQSSRTMSKTDCPEGPQIVRQRLAELTPGSRLASRAFAGIAAVGRSKLLPLFAYASAFCAVALAFLWMSLFDLDSPADYAACLLFAILVSACFGGRRIAFAIAALAFFAFDYFNIGPPHSLAFPDLEGAIRLALFGALSLLTITVVYSVRGRSTR